MERFRSRTTSRDLCVALALLAIALKLLVPAGFMPGTNLLQPIVLCRGQGPMPGMAMPTADPDHAASGSHHKTPHRDGDHGCPFGGLAALSLTIARPTADLPPVLVAPYPPRSASGHAAPGRGLAAPPPPSHAPPPLDA